MNSNNKPANKGSVGINISMGASIYSLNGMDNGVKKMMVKTNLSIDLRANQIIAKRKGNAFKYKKSVAIAIEFMTINNSESKTKMFLSFLNIFSTVQ